MKNTLFRQKEETHVSYGLIQSVLGAGVYGTLLPYEN
jgi:hypothetical protein